MILSLITAHIYNLSHSKLWIEDIFRTDWELTQKIFMFKDIP